VYPNKSNTEPFVLLENLLGAVKLGDFIESTLQAV